MLNVDLSARVETASFRKVPPELDAAVVRRCAWSLCSMEHSRIGAIAFEAPDAPFHHLALPLERVPLRIGLQVNGRLRYGRNAPDTITSIAAGAGGLTTWDGLFESACFYFTTQSLGLALGEEVGEHAHGLRTHAELHAPDLVRLLHALNTDAAAGQPHGALLGDSIFAALAARLVLTGSHRRVRPRANGEAWRVRRVLEFVHDRLAEPLDIAMIAAAADTSPFHLNRTFRATMGLSLWRYVLRERTRHAHVLMANARLTLVEIALQSGFETYGSFAAAVKATSGETPARLRASLFDK